ncbi:hypothetical protein Glove_348g30 [Diversispora epigaea]|uniref:rRNA adenine N(6)-methyltransferase n=1 Tax=Diversispora epigaea TaxID=1348612 RepID=A0A397HIY8_9GLOM|nr:hypothetical protein Glove_348g30 [Diversispora epigaea]
MLSNKGLLSVRDLVKIYKLSAKSQLSQNFILDKNVTDKIVKSSQIDSNDLLVVEVGAGPGLLTRSILDTGITNMIAVEKDKRFLPALMQLSEATRGVLKIIHDDMLKIDHSLILQKANIPNIDTEKIIENNSKINKINNNSIDNIDSRESGGGDGMVRLGGGGREGKLHLIGNLPFNVASPLLVQWMKMLYKREGIFKFPNVIMTLMFQKEVGDRIAASVKDPERSRISVLVQSLCEVRKVYQLPSNIFVPQPKVDATLIQLTALSKPVLNVPVDKFEEVVRYFYGRRRKTLRAIFKTIKSRISPTEQGLLDYNLEKLEWDLTLRPEKISSEEFCKLTKIFIENSITFPT